jgi:predicted metal-dependent phosphotriesterase family hydrolase
MILQTVLGAIQARDFGFALPHEHVMCDFVGAGETNPGRWDVEEVVAAIRPRLIEIRDRGVASFVDCTPAYIGRDPRVLRRLAEETGLQIVTNTGYYGGADDRFVPAHAYAESADQLARRWVEEAERGIEGTDVLPGFIKIGVDQIAEAGQLSAIDAKLAHAAALASRATGLSVTCHTGGGPAGYAALDRFVTEGGDPARFIVAHSDGHGHAINARVAAAGAWVSYDSIGWRPTAEHMPIILPMLDQHIDRLLLSQDSGWYWVGESGGGNMRSYNYLTDDLLPALRAAGATEAQIDALTVTNPARAFGR